MENVFQVFCLCTILLAGKSQPWFIRLQVFTRARAFLQKKFVKLQLVELGRRVDPVAS